MGLLSPEKEINGQKHILAYITPGEAETLEDLGGQKVMTSLGIPAYPPGMGDPNYAGAEGVDAPAGGASAGGDYGGNVNPSQTYAGHTVQEQRDYQADPQGYLAKHGGDFQPEETQWYDGIKDFILSGGIIGKGIELTGDVLSKIGEFSSGLQKKAMTMPLNNKITGIGKKSDFHPGAYGYKIQDIQSDLEGIEDGTFTQTDFTEKYGSGDLGGGEGGDGDRQLMNEFAPFASYAVANQTPIESQVDQWFANNQAGTGLDPNYLNTYNTAKTQIANTLGMVDTSNQFGYSNAPYGGLTATNLNTNPFNTPLIRQAGLI